jgi:hypothetical protein
MLVDVVARLVGVVLEADVEDVSLSNTLTPVKL